MKTPFSTCLIGSSIPSGADQLAVHEALKQGDIVLTLLPENVPEALAVARACRERGIYLVFSEMLHRGSDTRGWCWRRKLTAEEFMPKEDFDRIVDAAGDRYVGRVAIGEIGGVLYWPKAYTIDRRADNWRNLPPCRDHAEAEKAYVAYCRHWLHLERSQIGKGPLMDVDSSMLFKYHCMAGIDILCLEVMPGDPHPMHAAIRGAARAFRKPWGAHIAMQCYGGVCFDELYQKRWRTALFFSFISGADFIYPESGHLTYANQARGQRFDFDSPEMKRVRRAIRETWQFARVHSRPAGGPAVRLGIVHGRHDGTPGLWNRYVWGQYHDDDTWLEGPAERGWDLVGDLNRRRDWSGETVQGDEDPSGNPPCGQYDIVPIEAAPEVLDRYSCLFFVGWHTMTDADYDKLTGYVKRGGKLVMWLPQLSTRTDRNAPMSLLRDGDFSELFGCRVSGRLATDVRGIKCMRDAMLPTWRFPLWRISTDPRFLGRMTPARSVELTTGRVISGHSDFYDISAEDLERNAVLVENSLGRGVAYLVALWEYPADEGVRRFAEDLLRVAVQGEQGDIRLVAADRTRYAVYEQPAEGDRNGFRVVYVLNTDPDVPSLARLALGGRRTPLFRVDPGELRLAYAVGRCVIVPESRLVDIERVAGTREAVAVDLFAAADQDLLVCNLEDTATTVTVNGTRTSLAAGESAVLALARRVDPARETFFAEDFLEEPAVNYRHSGLPY